ncbi:MAG: DNA alkylation repair protein [Acidobacteria bacterium]|nr:DNA alkylation repair protein [Acidobacteriota bacterium]
MNFDDVMQQLEASGSEQTRKTYMRHGVTGAMFGVSYTTLGALKKKIKINHDLAAQLWATHNHDAQILATMIADPELMSAGLLEQWAKQLTNYVISDAFAKLAAQTPVAQKKLERWTDSKQEWLGMAGWSMLGQAVGNADLPDAYFEPYLAIIERDIHSRKNRVKHAMNMALIAIGTRNDNLQKKVLAVAKRIGKVEVDHGNTSCKTPDAAAYILKTVAHRKAQAPGR